MDHLKTKLKNLSGGRILDIGTGHGQFLKLLADSFADFTEATGVDVSSDNIELARQECGDRFHLEVMNGEKINFADNSVDTVSIRHSLHHIANIDVALLEMKRVLKPGGLFIICEVFQAAESARDNSQRHLHHWWAAVDRAQGGSHRETYTKPEILQLVEPLGLSEVDLFESLEEFEGDQKSEILDQMLNRSKSIIKKLIDENGPKELISRGEELVERFSKLGFINESALCILGRKTS